MAENRHSRRKTNALSKGQTPVKRTVTKSKNVKTFTAEDWISLHIQASEALIALEIEVPTYAQESKQLVKVAERNLQLSISTLAFVLTRILDAHQHTKTHAKTRQAEQLIINLKYIGEYGTGGRLDNQLDRTIANAGWNLSWVSELYSVLGYAREKDVSETDLKEGGAAIEIARTFRDATKTLLDGTDNGESLIATIETYQGDIQRLRGEALQAAAPDYGGRRDNDWLRDRWQELRDTKPPPKPRAIYEQIRGELANGSISKGFTPKPDLSPKQKRAYESVTSKGALNTFPKYYYDLFKADR
ncbi:MAG: hypothetical protein H0X30_25350 [Anaerolineae bacterium]|nr:hypothetical protein [Anaerolineae bacterium]